MDMALVAVLAECWYPKKSWRKKTINSCLGMILVYIIYTHVYIYIHVLFWELHRFLSGKEFTCQCRRHRRLEVDPWVRKISLTQGGGKDQGGGDGNPLQNSCWDNPMDRGAWWATVYRITKSLTWQSKHMHMHCFQYSFPFWFIESTVVEFWIVQL